MTYTRRAQTLEKNDVVKVGFVFSGDWSRFQQKNEANFDDVVLLESLSPSGVWHMISALRSEENPFLLSSVMSLLTYCSFFVGEVGRKSSLSAA